MNERIDEFMATREHWVLDKRLNIPIIAMLLGNFAYAAWYTSKVDSRITELEAKQVADALRLDATEKAFSESQQFAVRIDERLLAVTKSQDRIERSVDQLVQQNRQKP